MRTRLLLLPFAGPVIFLGGFERFLQADHVFAGAEIVERFGFALEHGAVMSFVEYLYELGK